MSFLPDNIGDMTIFIDEDEDREVGCVVRFQVRGVFDIVEKSPIFHVVTRLRALNLRLHSFRGNLVQHGFANSSLFSNVHSSHLAVVNVYV